jgi:hypothetical protein
VNFKEQRFRNDLADRLHLIAASVRDGTIAIEPLGMFLEAVPRRFVPSVHYKRYTQLIKEKNNGTVTQHSTTGIKDD